MSKWLKADVSSGSDAYVEWDPVGVALGNDFIIELDFVIPAATVAVILANSDTFTARVLDFGSDFGLGSLSALINAGPTLLARIGFDANPPSGVIPSDVSVHLKYELVYSSGTSWNVTVSIDGTVADTFLHNFVVTPTSNLSAVSVGALSSGGYVGEIYYIDNVTVTIDGTLVFSDDFEDGTTGAWTFSTGTVTVEEFTPGGGPTPPP